MCLPRIESWAVHIPITEVAGSRPIGMPIYQNHIFAFDDPDALAEAFAGPGGAFL
jgi:methionine-gamma-lyase